MTAIPNPWISDSAAPTAADTAVASNQHPHAQDATADPFESSMARGGQGAPAADQNPTAAGATDHIHEIFYHARKLMEPTRFVLDEERFMADIEEKPLFLRRRLAYPR